MNKYYGLITTTLIQIFFGLILIFISPATLLWVIFTIIGILVILSNIPNLLNGLANYSVSKEYKVMTISSIISIILGIIMIFWQNEIFSVIVAIWLLVLPLYRIIISNYKKMQLKKEALKLSLGIIVLIVGPLQSIEIIFKVIGIIVIAFTIVYFIASLILMKKNKSVDVDKNDYIDV